MALVSSIALSALLVAPATPTSTAPVSEIAVNGEACCWQDSDGTWYRSTLDDAGNCRKSRYQLCSTSSNCPYKALRLIAGYDPGNVGGACCTKGTSNR